MFATALNTGNFFVHRDSYLQVFDLVFDPSAADSLYFVYCWLSSGRKALFTPGLHYTHMVYHSHMARESYWQQHAKPSMEIADRVLQRMREGVYV